MTAREPSERHEAFSVYLEMGLEYHDDGIAWVEE
jgi:hypothetical protein